MSRQLVFDASPLILLTRIGQLDLLAEDHVMIPEGVLQEIKAGSAIDETAAILKSYSHFNIAPDVAVPPEIQLWSLGKGETRVLSHCLGKPDLEAVLDDRAARRCARSLGILTTGTLGLVLRGKKRGQLKLARPVVEDLVAAGLYLSHEMRDIILAEVGE